MRVGLAVAPFGDDYGDVRHLATMAHEAELAGWDGFFIWDHTVFSPNFYPIADPWVALTAIALSTNRIRLGALITPLARRRPWQVARETASLDRLSNGRLIVGVGLGDPAVMDYGLFGEEQDPKIRAQKLDEGLDILDGLWSGETFSYDGQHYQLQPVRFLPTPSQSPRIPVWVGGTVGKQAPMCRAARWDGFMPVKFPGEVSLDDWGDMMAYIRQHRTSDAPFDWVHAGATPGDDPAKATAIVREAQAIGITWWIETVDFWRFGHSWEGQLQPEYARMMDERIRQGPPGRGQWRGLETSSLDRAAEVVKPDEEEQD
jgi:alkanesulfonate monooxygenase SsuD/methylene tetrahydromethanopterin reductase-like flavin-dependent oxidoreductase (luciferase family)